MTRTLIVFLLLSSAAWAQGGNQSDPVYPDNLEQRDLQGNVIPVGGVSPDTTVVFASIAPADTDTYVLHVEAKYIGEAFNGTGVQTSAPVAGGAEATVTISGFLNRTGIHWQAAWQRIPQPLPFGFVSYPLPSPNPETDSDVRINSGTGQVLESFDGSPVLGWPMTPPVDGVGWAIDNDPGLTLFATSVSGNSLNYNNGFDYNSFDLLGTVPNSGETTSPLFDLTGWSTPELRFWCCYDTEPDETKDLRFIEVRDASGVLLTTFTLTPTLCGATQVFHEHAFPLDPSWNAIRLHVRFDTVDDQENFHHGWFIDDLLLQDSVPSTTGGGSGGGVTTVGGKDDHGDALCAAAALESGPLPALVLLFVLLMIRVRR